MLQTPINVFPSNGEVIHLDDSLRFSFTFQGDLCSWHEKEVYDLDTNKWVYSSYAKENCHNGHKVSTGQHYAALASCESGHNYKYIQRVFQCYPEGMPLAGQPLADMYYARGKIYERTEEELLSNNQLQIAPKLTNIRSPFYDPDHPGCLVGAIYMEIDHERRMITEYNSHSGVVTLSSMFSTYPEPGTAYKLFTNWIETGYHDFKVRDKPVITNTMIIQTNIDETSQWTAFAETELGVTCKSTYFQGNNVGLKWCQHQLYLVNALPYRDIIPYQPGNLCIYNNKLYRNLNFVSAGAAPDTVSGNWEQVSAEKYGTFIEESERDYSYDLQHSFHVNPFYKSYIVKTIMATQEDDIATEEIAMPIIEDFVEDAEGYAPDIKEVVINNRRPSINIDDKTVSVTVNDPEVVLELYVQQDHTYVYNVYRREVYSDGTVSDEAVYVGTETGSQYKYGEEGKEGGIGYRTVIRDVTVGNNTTYQYEIVAKSRRGSEFGKPLSIHYIYNVRVEWDGWYIYSLNSNPTAWNGWKWDTSSDKVLHASKSLYNRQLYDTMECWHFISDIDSGNITHNINPTLHVGTSNYSVTTRNQNIYESGTFTANLLTVECPDGEIIDDIQRVKAWKKFISGDNSFLLKSAKGDVWVVNITNNPTRTYQESYEPIFTNIAYEWAECKDVNKCVFND